MKLHKFDQFKSLTLINEDIKQARAYLKKRITTLNGEEVTAKQIQDAENDPAFIKLKTLLAKTPAYIYTFVRFYYEYGISLDNLERIYKELQSLKNLPGIKPIGEYNKNFTKPNGDIINGFERLEDDIENAKNDKIVATFVSRLPGAFVVNADHNKGREVPSIRDEYRNAPQVIKDKVRGIALAFETVCKFEDGKIDHEACLNTKMNFLKTIKRHQGLNEIIQAANATLKSANNLGVVSMTKAIDKVNSQFGITNGAQVLFNENEILVILVNSYQANKVLNANTSHCIKDSIYHWNTYVGGDDVFNNQYYIYNFNLDVSDNNAVIGITINDKHGIRAAHAKDDSDVEDKIKKILSKWEKEYSLTANIFKEILLPMSPTEIEIKKKRIIANKELRKPDLTIEQIRGYIKDGGDPNLDSGLILANLIKANRVEDVNILITEFGAITDIGNISEYPIKYCKSFEMMEVLIANDATITNAIMLQENILKDIKMMTYLFDNGANPNDGKGVLIRNSAKGGYYDVTQLLFDRGALLDNRGGLTIIIMLDTNDKNCYEILVKQIAKEKLINFEKLARCIKGIIANQRVDSDNKIYFFQRLKELAIENKVDYDFIEEALFKLGIGEEPNIEVE